ncbi:Glycosyltransferase, probably involved in cell wall biogenesis [Hahella chejuensis KCTC 2396]|uniref:Glycosyltransferase, probably involved in cell wall biogenesis n=1 Tax=Hahella chejuensis (strain KCTC 2396) TaxID=349521 RepID=Q2SBM8_HAHCH|nr:glycosyltransferase family 2 protein [Hahella chejuensis]ABC31946.1 Glycosyltransferase, probably involved in cell wall biogenesis [Hahella chejuensis KCTC 2396]
MNASINIDIVIPVFNGEAHILECLKSIDSQKLYQTYKINIIAVDDSSTDKSYEYLKSHTGNTRLKIIQHSENKGRSSTINTGVKAGSAPFIIILDCDCQWQTPHALHDLINPLLQYGKIACFGLTTSSYHDSGFWARYLKDVCHERKSGKIRNQTTANFSITRTALVKIGYFSNHYHSYGFEDRDLISRLVSEYGDQNMIVASDCIATHTTNGLTVKSMGEKFYAAGKESSVIFFKQHPEAYREAVYAKFDAEFISNVSRSLLKLTIPLSSAFIFFLDFTISNSLLPYLITKYLVKSALAISYFKGTLDRKSNIFKEHD